MNRVLILFLLIVCVSNLTKGQNQKENKYFSIGTKTSGVCLGSSTKFNGIRFSYSDAKEYQKVQKINGINLSLVISSEIANGIQVGIVLIVEQGQANGINIGGFGIKGETINGFSIASLSLFGNKINGISSSLHVGGEQINGITIAGWSDTKAFNGLSIAVYNHTENLHGLQIGILNHVASNPKLLRWLPILNFHP